MVRANHSVFYQMERSPLVLTECFPIMVFTAMRIKPEVRSERKRQATWTSPRSHSPGPEKFGFRAVGRAGCTSPQQGVDSAVSRRNTQQVRAALPPHRVPTNDRVELVIVSEKPRPVPAVDRAMVDRSVLMISTARLRPGGFRRRARHSRTRIPGGPTSSWRSPSLR